MFCTMEKDGVGVDLIGKIEKVEGDLKSSTTIIRALSRQLEKLGIRFRVTRKGLKEPLDQVILVFQILLHFLCFKSFIV